MALAACVSAPPPAAPPVPPPQPRSIVHEPALRHLGPAISGVKLEVRGPGEADTASIEELRELTERMTKMSVGISGLAIAEAFLLPGFFSGSLVAGGLIIAPLAVGINQSEKKQHQAIVTALVESDLLGRTRDFLGRQLPPPAPGHVLSVIVLAYGLVPKYGDGPGPGPRPLCLTLVADIVLREGELVRFRDTVHLEPYRRSADAPPPVCAAMAAFAKEEGRALRHAATDYAQVLAAIVRGRLPALPWQP